MCNECLFRRIVKLPDFVLVLIFYLVLCDLLIFLNSLIVGHYMSVQVTLFTLHSTVASVKQSRVIGATDVIFLNCLRENVYVISSALLKYSCQLSTCVVFWQSHPFTVVWSRPVFLEGVGVEIKVSVHTAVLLVSHLGLCGSDLRTCLPLYAKAHKILTQ